MKILYCDVDSTLNNHWVRIQKWAVPSFPGTDIAQNAFTREEIMKDEPLPHSVETLKEFSKEYEIHILSARGFEDSYQITKDWLLYTDVIEDLKNNNINLEIFKNNWLEIKQKYLGE